MIPRQPIILLRNSSLDTGCQQYKRRPRYEPYLNNSPKPSIEMSYTSSYSFGNGGLPQAPEVARSNKVLGILIGAILGLLLVSIAAVLWWAHCKSTQIMAARDAISAGRDLESGCASPKSASIDGSEPLPTYSPPAGPPLGRRAFDLTGSSVEPASEPTSAIVSKKENEPTNNWVESSPLPPYDFDMEEISLDAPPSSGTSSRETLVDSKEGVS